MKVFYQTLLIHIRVRDGFSLYTLLYFRATVLGLPQKNDSTSWNWNMSLRFKLDLFLPVRNLLCLLFIMFISCYRIRIEKKK